jgi:mannosyltransferase OCH1-like enzyme
MSIPRRIIQTHRDSIIQAEFRQSWIDQHPGYEYCFFDDHGSRSFVAEQMPALLATYDALPLDVQKADLFRYIAVYQLGGLYADVDTVCQASVHDYLDLGQASLQVCCEMTPAEWPKGLADYPEYFCLPRQFLQWTFCAPPKHPALMLMIERIRYLVGLQVPDELAELSRSTRFTLELTGPHMFTRVIDEYLARGADVATVKILPRLTWGSYPWEQIQPIFSPSIKVRHMFEGSWLSGGKRLVTVAPMRLKSRY